MPSGTPYVAIRPSLEPFGRDGVHVVPPVFHDADKSIGNVLVELYFHASEGAGGIGKSSSAETAAKAMIARTADSSSVGKSLTICTTLIPSARLAKMVRTVTRVPLTTGSPAQIAGSRTIYGL